MPDSRKHAQKAIELSGDTLAEADTALASVMLILSFVLLFAINLGQGWLRRRTGALQEAA